MVLKIKKQPKYGLSQIANDGGRDSGIIISLQYLICVRLSDLAYVWKRGWY